jgi:hypothetical protein
MNLPTAKKGENLAFVKKLAFVHPCFRLYSATSRRLIA